MRINLLPPDLRVRHTGLSFRVVLIIAGVLLATYLGYLAHSVSGEYAGIRAQVQFQRKRIQMLQEFRHQAEGLQEELRRRERNLELLRQLPADDGPVVATSALLAHIARSAEQSGKVWLEKIYLSSGGPISLQGWGYEPRDITNLVHRLSRWPSFYGIDIESLERVDGEAGSPVQFSAQVSPPEVENDGQ